MKQILKNIIYYGNIKVKKISNSIRYYPISKHINNNFGNKENLIKYNHNRSTGPEPCICHAPSRSLYLDSRGNATACCFNRVHILGKYPEQSLKEIVNSEKRKFLQTELCRQNFMYGCQHCHKLIEAQNFEGVEARLYDNLKSQKGIPSEIIFELDNTCNLACAMCNEAFSSTIAKNKGLETKAPPYDGEFLNQLQEFIPYLKTAKFLGGEPFLINIYYKIWDMILEINPKCKIHLQTNGTIFNDKIKSYLEKVNFHIGVSIDSIEKENYEKIRRNANFEKVMENLFKFAEISKRKNNFLNISVCPMLQNWKEIPNIVKFCNENSFFIYFNTVYTPGFSLKDADEDLLLEVINYYKSVDIKSIGIIGKRSSNFFYDLISQIEAWYNQKAEANKKFKKIHKWTSKMLMDFMLNKVEAEAELSKIINEVFIDFNQEFSFSDLDLENLNNLKIENLISALRNEPIVELQEKIKRFIKLGTFGR